MSAVLDRSTAIEALQRMTSRLADSNLTVAEANALRPQIHRLLDEISRVGLSRAERETTDRR